MKAKPNYAKAIKLAHEWLRKAREAHQRATYTDVLVWNNNIFVLKTLIRVANEAHDIETRAAQQRNTARGIHEAAVAVRHARNAFEAAIQNQDATQATHYVMLRDKYVEVLLQRIHDGLTL